VEIFKTKTFTRFACREKIADRNLRESIDRAEKGLIDADLGGGLIKQRIGRSGQGRSGGYRTLIAYRSGNIAIFLFGFAKSDQDNVDDDDLDDLRTIARQWLADAKKVARDIAAGILIETTYDDEH
jgi:hypothetical protein